MAPDRATAAPVFFPRTEPRRPSSTSLRPAVFEISSHRATETQGIFGADRPPIGEVLFLVSFVARPARYLSSTLLPSFRSPAAAAACILLSFLSRTYTHVVTHTRASARARTPHQRDWSSARRTREKSKDDDNAADPG